MKILIVEDEVKLAAYLKKGLTEEGFQVVITTNGNDGLHLALEGDFQAIILDRMLPGLDGMTLLSALRSQKSTPVLMLTAVDGVEDRVSGLTLGADDYLTKPFAFSELVARLHVLLRRKSGPDTSAAQPTVLTLADLKVDLLAHKATRAGQPLSLTAKEFALLSLLIRHQGKVFSRTVLAEKVWDMNFDSGTNAVEVAVRRLRTKLDVPFDRPLLHTERGMGYVLEERTA